LIIVTGAAGFIGSYIVSVLNKKGRKDLILVDDLSDHLPVEKTSDPKRGNLQDKKFEQYYDKKEFISLVRNSGINNKIEAVIHMGACS